MDKIFPSHQFAMSEDTPHLKTDEIELPPIEQNFSWPQQAIKDGDWNESARRWTIFRHAYPNHAAPWVQGALAYIEMGEYKKAESLLGHARQQFPSNPNALIFSGDLCIRQKKWEAAENFLQQARKRFPNFMPTWMKSTECAELQGDIEQATAYNEKARQCAPDMPGPLIQYAELAMREKQWQEALERWKKLRENFPNIPAAYHRAAQAARQLGRPKEARQLLLIHQYGADTFNSKQEPQKTLKQKTSKPNLRILLGLIWTKAVFNLRSEVHRNYLSYGWWILEPLLHMIIYYIVFGILLKRGEMNYPVFLLTGLIPWMWFSKAVNGSSGSILAGQNLMLQVGVPSLVFPLVSILQATIKQIPVFMLLLGFVWWQGYPPNVHWWILIPIIFLQTLFTIAFACAVAAVIPFARDLAYLVPTGLTFLMFLSGIFYDYRSISPEWQQFFLLNPIAFLLKSYREILMENIMPNLYTILYWGVASGAGCLLLIASYQRLRYIYPRIVME